MLGQMQDFELARRVAVPPDRLAGWVRRFIARHGEVVTSCSVDALWLRAADHATAKMVNQWEPLPPATELAAALEHFARPRTIAVLLVRKGADAVAVAHGEELLAHRVSRHYVQARTKAGGWSQQRYARRRQNQAASAYADAAENAVEVILPRLAEVEALITGGDRVGLREVLADRRLAGLLALPQRHPVLPVPDGRLVVLAEAVQTARSVPIELDAQAIA